MIMWPSPPQPERSYWLAWSRQSQLNTQNEQREALSRASTLLLKDGDNASMSYARHIVALDLVNGQSGNHDRESMIQALGIYLAHGSIGQAAALARDLSNLYISPDKINVRLRLLNTARDLYQKLRKAWA
jgi:hypothetical protein